MIQKFISSRLRTILSVLCAGIILGSATQLYSERGKKVEFGKISLPLGRVQVQSAGSSDWQRALPKKAVFVGDVIKTLAKSRCEITLKGGGKLRIGEKAELELTHADIKPMNKTFDANLKKGNVWISAKAAFGEKKNVSVRTPTAVAAIRGTTYRAAADSAESSVLVYSGRVDVNAAKNVIDERKERRKELFDTGTPFKLGPVKKIEAPTEVSGPYEVSLEDWIKLAEGWCIQVRSDGKYHLFEFDKEADAKDDFVQWNKELDSK